ncbi:MAG: Uma2 family endonuclease [Dehalococcoidia bacterium]
MRLSPYSEPEPDVAILRFRDDFYRTAKAGPADVLLLIEVARSSLDYDRHIKLPLYAAAGIIEVWLVNLVAQVVEVYRDPAPEGYRRHTVHGRGESIALLALPDVAVAVAEILG